MRSWPLSRSWQRAATTASRHPGQPSPTTNTATPGPPPDSGSGSDSGSDFDFGRDYTLIPNRAIEHLEAGRWALRNTDGPAPLAVFEVPGGFGSGGGILWGEEGYVGYWVVASVFEDPCAGDDLPVKVGPTVADLAAGLADQEMTTTTDPVPVSVDGHDGLYLELTMPTELDFKTCDQDHFFIWQSTATKTRTTAWRATDTSMVDRYWILDVDGRRLVLSTALPHGADGETVEEHSRMVQEVEFVHRRRH